MNEQSITVQCVVEADTREAGVVRFMEFFAEAVNLRLARDYGIVAVSIERVMTEEEHIDYLDAITGNVTRCTTEGRS